MRETCDRRRRAVVVTLRTGPRAGVGKFTGAEPPGCRCWRVATGGRSFDTVAGDARGRRKALATV